MTIEASASAVPGWLSPLVAVLGGAVIGGLALFALVFPFAETGAAVAFVVWLGATVHLLRRPTIYALVQHGAYGLAVVLVALPAGLLLGTTADPATRLTALVLYEVVGGAFALGVVALGYVVGQAAPSRPRPRRDSADVRQSNDRGARRGPPESRAGEGGRATRDRHGREGRATRSVRTPAPREIISR